jgi:FKBP-type peptidyl-prolyl cis-trans isomerase 2
MIRQGSRVRLHYTLTVDDQLFESSRDHEPFSCVHGQGQISDPANLKQGDTVSGQAQGQPFQAKVANVGTEEVTLDLNHPLAGKTLHFDVEILEVG